MYLIALFSFISRVSTLIRASEKDALIAADKQLSFCPSYISLLGTGKNEKITQNIPKQNYFLLLLLLFDLAYSSNSGEGNAWWSRPEQAVKPLSTP